MIFIDNKYRRWYYRIIENAKSRVDSYGYTERHHIIPRSLGGKNNVDNLANLTAKEHFICHRLLTKITEGEHKKKMIYAQNMMLVKTDKQKRITVNSNTYTSIKEEFSKINLFNDPEFQIKVRKYHTGKTRSKETIEKLKNSWTEERKEAASKRFSGIKKSEPSPLKGRPRPDLAGVNNGFYGKKHSEEFIKKRKQELSGKPAPWANHKIVCPHCNRLFDLGNFKKNHGDKCKLKL
jgi:hypothetical protein